MTIELQIIPLTECIAGHAYRIQSRNLIVGVFNGNTGFVGIRSKFDSEYLFTEYHYDTGPPLGTVNPFRDLGECPITDLAETHRVVAGDPPPADWIRPGDTYHATNQPLFDWLTELERIIAEPCPFCKESFYPVPWALDPGCYRHECYLDRTIECMHEGCKSRVFPEEGVLCEPHADPVAWEKKMTEARRRLETERAARVSNTSEGEDDGS